MQSANLFGKIFYAWQEEYARMQSGVITKEEYDDWRYNYPKGEVEKAKAALSKNLDSKKNDEPDEK